MASTAWVNRTSNKFGRIQQTFDLAIAGNGQGYTTVIDAIKIRQGNDRPETQRITFTFDATAVTGSNLDVALYGSNDRAGTDKYLLKDILVADITATGIAIGIFDLQLYPAPFYFISVIGDNAETGNTLALTISGDLNGSQSS